MVAVPSNTVAKVLLAAPRGYCAGVDRAVETVERALERYGPPVYVRKEIVHNKHVVDELRDRGAIFVESETEVPEGDTAVFSAPRGSPGDHVCPVWPRRPIGCRWHDGLCPRSDRALPGRGRGRSPAGRRPQPDGLQLP